MDPVSLTPYLATYATNFHHSTSKPYGLLARVTPILPREAPKSEGVIISRLSPACPLSFSLLSSTRAELSPLIIMSTYTIMRWVHCRFNKYFMFQGKFI